MCAPILPSSATASDGAASRLPMGQEQGSWRSWPAPGQAPGAVAYIMWRGHALCDSHAPTARDRPPRGFPAAVRATFGWMDKCSFECRDRLSIFRRQVAPRFLLAVGLPRQASFCCRTYVPAVLTTVNCRVATAAAVAAAAAGNHTGGGPLGLRLRPPRSKIPRQLGNGNRMAPTFLTHARTHTPTHDDCSSLSSRLSCLSCSRPRHCRSQLQRFAVSSPTVRVALR